MTRTSTTSALESPKERDGSPALHKKKITGIQLAMTQSPVTLPQSSRRRIDNRFQQTISWLCFNAQATVPGVDRNTVYTCTNYIQEYTANAPESQLSCVQSSDSIRHTECY